MLSFGMNGVSGAADEGPAISCLIDGPGVLKAFSLGSTLKDLLLFCEETRRIVPSRFNTLCVEDWLAAGR
jgi:hypothetical protein